MQPPLPAKERRPSLPRDSLEPCDIVPGRAAWHRELALQSERASASLFTVVAAPRSGTQWFSRLLTTDRSFCYHELTTLIRPHPTNVILDQWFTKQCGPGESDARHRRWLLQCYPDYFARLWERATCGQQVVGNSDSQLITHTRGLWLLWPAMKFVFSTRNGISVVQSRQLDTIDFNAAFLARQRQRWGTGDIIAILCHQWVDVARRTAVDRQWLQERGAHCFETTLERMTTDLQEIKRLWDFVEIGQWDACAERNTALQTTLVNARTGRRGLVRPEEIWNQWTEDRRRLFTEICSQTMNELGYALPN